MLTPLDMGDDARWKQRFRVPSIATSQIADSNPARGLVVTNLSGVYQLHAWQTESGALHQRTDLAAGVVFGGISADGAYLYYLHDAQGNEVGHVVRIPFEGGTPQSLTPQMLPYATWFLSESKSGNAIGLTTADASGFKMLLIPKAPDGTLSDPQTVYTSARLSYGPLLSHDAEYAVIATTERSQHTDMALMAFDLRADSPQQTVRVLQETDGDLSPLAFAPLKGDARLLASTNVSGFDRPVIWDVSDGSRLDIPLQGIDGSVHPRAWSPDGQRILVMQVAEARNQLYIYDIARSRLSKLNHPEGVIAAAYFHGENEIYAHFQSATQPAALIALDAVSGAQKRIVLSGGDAPECRPMRSITFPSVSGSTIQAWLATPEGDGPFPTIIDAHGGPTAVQLNTYMPGAQMWLESGFAYCSVNYHGSTTFGRQFEHSILGNLGDLEVEDLAAARTYLVDNRIAQPDAVIVMGASYGGYLTLQALGKKPGLWAGGIAIVAIADWVLMYEDQAETLRGYQRALFGGTPQEKPEQYAASSPITYAEQVNAPLLILQGENDTRCPARQMRVYEQRLRDLGKSVEIHWFDAGHGSRAMAQNIAHHEIMLRWVYRILG